ncbi:SDR family oxidoreductase [Nonomuraea turcica]|uniref:SDR family oxidoreductase n=1 Tax=Nonomuraea sp. G32 TaxID=3067274 RepID=UPI00273A7BEE|nr:SDR family oxidoreductase [Nonomuraea sp. G32]MDP4500555.1 SDR family oxidoreductase [Nonomuraea sp. G32]
MTKTLERKVVLVTGASSGIGEATARTLAAAGHHVILTARRADRIKTIADDLSVAGFSAEARPLDVTDGARFHEVAEEVVTSYGRLDVLVGNAGVMLLSRLDALLVEEWEQMLDVNVRGLLNGIAATLPIFQSQGSGHFVTVASIGAHQVVETSAIYSATKYAAWALTEGLRQESEPGIRVTTISPGVVDTELADHITDPEAAEAMRTYRAALIRPEDIANAIKYALDQPSDVDVNEIILRPSAQRP